MQIQHMHTHIFILDPPPPLLNSLIGTYNCHGYRPDERGGGRGGKIPRARSYERARLTFLQKDKILYFCDCGTIKIKRTHLSFFSNFNYFYMFTIFENLHLSLLKLHKKIIFENTCMRVGKWGLDFSVHSRNAGTLQ